MIVEGYSQEDKKKVDEIMNVIKNASLIEIQMLIDEFEKQYGTSFANVNSASSNSNQNNDSENETQETKNKNLFLTQLALDSPIKKRKFITGLVDFFSKINKEKLGDRFAKLPKISLTSLTLDLSHANDVSDSKPIEIAINITPEEEKEFSAMIEGIEGIKYTVK